MPGKPEIEQDEVAASRAPQRVNAIRRHLDVVALPPERPGERLADRGIVFGQQDDSHSVIVGGESSFAMPAQSPSCRRRRSSSSCSRKISRWMSSTSGTAAISRRPVSPADSTMRSPHPSIRSMTP